MRKDDKNKWTNFPEPTSSSKANNLVLQLPSAKRATKALLKPPDTFSLFSASDIVDEIDKYYKNWTCSGDIALKKKEQNEKKNEVYFFFAELWDRLICNFMGYLKCKREIKHCFYN